MITIPMPDWYEAAVCASVGADYWFPEKGTNVLLQAKAICGRCDVSRECLEYALANQEQWGMWGGLTYKQRLKLVRDQGAAA